MTGSMTRATILSGMMRPNLSMCMILIGICLERWRRMEMLSTGMIRKAVSGWLSKKRFLALFLTVALVFSCVGCSEDSSVEDNGEYEKIGRAHV